MQNLRRRVRAAFRDQNKRQRSAKLPLDAWGCGEEHCVFVDITSDIDDFITLSRGRKLGVSFSGDKRGQMSRVSMCYKLLSDFEQKTVTVRTD